MSDDLRPGELLEVVAAVTVAEDPAVLPGGVEHAEVPADDPAFRLVRVGADGPPVGESPHVVVQRAECRAGDRVPVVGGPSPDNRVEGTDDRGGVGPVEGFDLGGEPVPEPLHGRFARFYQKLSALVSHGISEEVETISQVDDARLVLVEGQPSGREPGGELCLDLFSLLARVRESDEAVTVSDDNRAARLGLAGVDADGVQTDACGLFHTV